MHPYICLTAASLKCRHAIDLPCAEFELGPTFVFRFTLKFRKSPSKEAAMSGAAKLRKEEKEPHKVTSCLCWHRFFSFCFFPPSEAPGCDCAPRCLRVCTRSTSLMKQSGCKGSSAAKRHKTNSRWLQFNRTHYCCGAVTASWLAAP